MMSIQTGNIRKAGIKFYRILSFLMELFCIHQKIISVLLAFFLGLSFIGPSAASDVKAASSDITRTSKVHTSNSVNGKKKPTKKPAKKKNKSKSKSKTKKNTLKKKKKR